MFVVCFCLFCCAVGVVVVVVVGAAKLKLPPTSTWDINTNFANINFLTIHKLGQRVFQVHGGSAGYTRCAAVITIFVHRFTCAVVLLHSCCAIYSKNYSENVILRFCIRQSTFATEQNASHKKSNTYTLAHSISGKKM